MRAIAKPAPELKLKKTEHTIHMSMRMCQKIEKKHMAVVNIIHLMEVVRE